MGINLPDIMCTVQFKIADYIILPELLQRLSRAGKDISRLAVAIIFVCTSQILLDNVQSLESSPFKNL